MESNDVLRPAGEVLKKLAAAERLWLFLDYDGTLADFAPTPDTVAPDADLITLLSQFVQLPGLRLAIVSGRRLAHIHKLIPLTGFWLAGSYGVELSTPGGEQINRLNYELIRPLLENLRPVWERLTHIYPGFYLEDKGWSLAIHARFARDSDAVEILQAAAHEAASVLRTSQTTLLYLQGGHKFLEVCSPEMDKGKAIAYILSADPFAHSIPVFLGDDDKDEHAFKMIKVHDGVAVVVTSVARLTQADFYLENPSAVRSWLTDLLRLRTLRNQAPRESFEPSWSRSFGR